MKELKGNANDWEIFYKTGKLCQQFKLNNSAFSYYELAHNHLINSLKNDSLNSEIYSDLGKLYLNLKSYDNSFYYFLKAYELNPLDSGATNFLPMHFIKLGQYDDAKKIIDQVLAKNPKNLEMYIWQITLEVFKKAGELDKTNPKLIHIPVLELFDLKEFRQSIEKIKTDIRFEVLENVCIEFAIFAKYMILVGDFKTLKIIPADMNLLTEIRNTLEKSISKNTFRNKYILFKALGFNYLLSGEKGKAVEFFQKSIQLWPADKSSQDYYNLFTTNFFIRNDTISSLRNIDAKISNDEVFMIQVADDYIVKGQVLLRQKKYQPAAIEFKKSMDIEKKPTAFQGLSFIEMTKMNLNEANRWLNQAYEIDQNDYLTFVIFGCMMVLNNQKEESKTYFDKAIRIKPEDEDILQIMHYLWPEN
jgi:tetratricopeptide (TPR) repeat protein